MRARFISGTYHRFDRYRKDTHAVERIWTQRGSGNASDMLAAISSEVIASSPRYVGEPDD